MDNMIENEHDYWKNKMMKVKKTALLAIYEGYNNRIVMEKLLSYFDNYVRDELVKNLKKYAVKE